MTRATTAIAVLVLLTLLHVAGVATAIDDPALLRVRHDAFGWLGSVLGVAGAVLAIGCFRPGDHLRKVWTLLAWSAALLLLGTALRSYWTHAAPGENFIDSPLLIPRFFVVAAANVCATWALILLATTFRRSGLAPESNPVVAVAWVAIGGVALFLLQKQLRLDFARMDSTPGFFSGLTSIFSTLGDTVTILLIVPILRIAYLLRGGKVAWAWWALGASGAVWLIYDVREWMAAIAPGDAAITLEYLRALRTPGLALVGLAGYLQRVALGPDVALTAPPSPAVDVVPQ